MIAAPAVAFRAALFHDTFRLGAATVAAERCAPTHSRPRRLPFHRGATGRGATVTLQNDDGVPLAAALDLIATPEERAALAAWRAKSDATRRYFIAWRNNHEDSSPATQATPRAYEPGGGLCEYAPYVKPTYLAAAAAMEACAARLTAALRSGAWVLRYQAQQAGAPVEAAPASLWADMRVRVDSALAARLDMAPGVRPPAWLLPGGHREPLLYRPAPAAERDPARKTPTDIDESRIVEHLIAAAKEMPAAERDALTAAGWQAKAQDFNRLLSDTGFEERIWPRFNKKREKLGFPLRGPGRPRKPENKGG